MTEREAALLAHLERACRGAGPDDGVVVMANDPLDEREVATAALPSEPDPDQFLSTLRRMLLPGHHGLVGVATRCELRTTTDRAIPSWAGAALDDSGGPMVIGVRLAPGHWQLVPHGRAPWSLVAMVSLLSDVLRPGADPSHPEVRGPVDVEDRPGGEFGFG